MKMEKSGQNIRFLKAGPLGFVDGLAGRGHKGRGRGWLPNSWL